MTMENKIPSPELLSLIKAAAQSLLGFGELWNSIKKKGHDEGFTERELQDILRPLLKPQLNKDQIYYLFNADEKKEQSKQSYHRNIPTNAPKKALVQNPIPIKLPDEPPKIPPPPPEEDPKDLEVAYWKEKATELEDALHKISDKQFVPATQLQEQPPPVANPTPELQMTDDLVFQYLRDRAKETGNILIIDRVGAGALVQALSQYKNSFGVAELFLRVIK
jgi:hypothetical protein